jgi:hypothetical protein
MTAFASMEARRKAPVAVAIASLIAVDVFHDLWHYLCADATAAELLAGLVMTAVIGIGLILPHRRRRPALGAIVLVVAGGYSLLRGVNGMFFSDEQAWPHGLLALSGILALVTGARALGASDRRRLDRGPSRSTGR